MNAQAPLHIAVLHNNALEEAQALAQKVMETYHPAELIITIVSPNLACIPDRRPLRCAGIPKDD